jgi:hypothetical protein
MIKHLRASWLLLAMLIVVTLGEVIAWQICTAFGWRFPAVTIAAVCIGLVAAFVSWQYDGLD